MRPAATSTVPQSPAQFLSRAKPVGMDPTARASMVNRTHRVVRERARAMQANRTAMRGLLLPMLLCAILMVTLLCALWMLLDQYDLVSYELPASLHHFFVMLLWFLPVSAALVAMVWFRRGRHAANAEVAP